MKSLNKLKIFIFFSVLSVFLVFLFLFSHNSLNKIKGDVSNFTPQANYNLSTNDKIDPTTWVAVDNLGRSISVSGEKYINGVTNTNMTVGTSINNSKQVGLFYHNWHNVVRHNTKKPLIIEDGKAYMREQNLNPIYYSSWKNTPYHGSLWWNEPVYGFYNPKDKYVIRKQIELISDAGIDFLVLDYTNYNHIDEYSPYCSDPVCNSTCSCLSTCNQTYPNDATARSNCKDNCTNNEPVSCTLINSVYRDELDVLFEVLDDAQTDGIKTPKITFMLSHEAHDSNSSKCKCPPDDPNCSKPQDCRNANQHTKVMVQWLWTNVYTISERKGHLLYGAGNRPIILAQHPSSITWMPDSTYASVISESTFHWRYMGNQYENAAYNTSRYDWSWIDKYPQTKYMYNTSASTTNEIAVSPAQHTDKNPNNGAIAFSTADTHLREFDMLGRSNAVGDDYNYSFQYRNNTYDVGTAFQITPGIGVGTLYGRNFQQQWDYAISTNPEFVMVTGWNEYLAGSFCEHFPNCDGPNELVMFVDQYNDEFSRDLEPVKGSLKDSYYYQLVSNIRRYKGANGQKSQPTSKSIDIYGDPNQWHDSNLLDYNSYTNATEPERNINNNEWGYKNSNKLTNVGVKNDIRTAKVSYDSSYIYFYVETVDNITNIEKLRLLIDTLDARTSTSTINWNEFEYVINRNGATPSTLLLEKVKKGCKNEANPSASNSTCAWESVGRVYYSIVNNTMQVSIPRSYLGLTSTNINFNFKWADNNLNWKTNDDDIHDDLAKMYDIMSIYTDGDAAPGGRFAYKFSGSEPYSVPKEYTVKFNANGGTGGQSANVSATFGAKMPTISTTKPTRPGYTFMGWYDNATYTSGTRYYTASGSGARLFNKTTTTTLYAGWKANTYTVKFNANGGSGGQSENVTATYGSAMPTISTTKPTRPGYTFMGWYDNSTYTSGTQYYTAAGASARTYNKTTATTLYAGWKAKTYTITYDANGGTGAPSSQSYTYAPSGTISLSNIKPSRYGYTFLGWSESSTATTAQYTAGQSLNKSKAKNYTLYAVWIESDNLIDISALTIKENVIILPKNSTLSTIYNTINNDHGITIYDNDQEVGLNTKLKTNNELHVNNEVYSIAILGDVRADGIINSQDVGKAYRITANITQLADLTTAEKYALDINMDGYYNLLDVNNIYKKNIN